MMAARAIQPARGSAPATPVSIRELLEWAFGRELARLDFDEIGAVRGDRRVGVGTEYLLMQRQLLGCQIDGGGRSEPHPDADTVASALAALPEGHGGRATALWIADLARAGMAPEWRYEERKTCEPVAWRACKHGTRYAVTESAGQVQYVHRGRLRQAELRVCPVRFRDPAPLAARARRDYLRWWGALFDLQQTFRLYGGLTAFVVTEAMPVMEPWRKG
ncbi:hypothetical protein [Arenibacterium halophilum]|uniref:Uncharacterized protein n=1 Tax=Arenibacterium halophilum TaxID=2583821 RepID=A0ABY2XBP3_9RHOB|nr:hypothetical protein [Arenibacterium halophilum]TMV14419.1 hypothetical protein FGK64_00030 [Arenibacterium halophilum]